MNIFKTPEGYLYTNKALLYLFLPLLVEYALEFFVGLADSIMVASLGEAAISGVSLVDFLIQLLIFSFSALATGGAVVAGQYLGDKQIDKAQNSATQLVWFSTILSFVLMILVMILRHFLIGLLFGQIEADVWNNADMYLYIVALSIPFIAIYNAGAAIFRTTNNAVFPMKVMIICDVLNVLGNAFCIYYLGWDVRGVAMPIV
ncbi:MATE family efflux transporter [Methanobrevibacter sp.]|uniref:MATE family efflux transporter n=1 Tax=Methanobrevibacter sp. TaxID=66852 RepID=UPI00386BF7B3